MLGDFHSMENCTKYPSQKWIKSNKEFITAGNLLGNEYEI